MCVGDAYTSFSFVIVDRNCSTACADVHASSITTSHLSISLRIYGLGFLNDNLLHVRWNQFSSDLVFACAAAFAHACACACSNGFCRR